MPTATIMKALKDSSVCTVPGAITFANCGNRKFEVNVEAIVNNTVYTTCLWRGYLASGDRVSINVEGVEVDTKTWKVWNAEGGK